MLFVDSYIGLFNAKINSKNTLEERVWLSKKRQKITPRHLAYPRFKISRIYKSPVLKNLENEENILLINIAMSPIP